MKHGLLSGVLALLFVCSAGAVYAQQSKKSGSSSGRIISVITAKDKVENMDISTGLMETPKFLIDGYNVEHSKQERRNAKGWLAIIIPFKTTPEKDSAWLENVRVTVEVMLPLVNDKQKVELGVLTGSAELAPISNTTETPYHYIRFYVDPYTVARYFPLRTDRKSLEKFTSELPLRVTFEYNNNKYYGGRAAGKDFAKIAGKLLPGLKIGTSDKDVGQAFALYDNSPRRFFVLQNSIIPACKTPWQWYDYDKFEATIDKQGR